MELNPDAQAAETLLDLSARTCSDVANYARSAKHTTKACRNDCCIVPITESEAGIASIASRERGSNEGADSSPDEPVGVGWTAPCASSFGSNEDSVHLTCSKGLEAPVKPVHFKYSGYNLFVKVCMVDIHKRGEITPETYKNFDVINATWEEMKKTGRLAGGTGLPGSSRAHRKRRRKNTTLGNYGTFPNLAKEIGRHWKEVKTDRELRGYYTSLVSTYTRM